MSCKKVTYAEVLKALSVYAKNTSDRVEAFKNYLLPPQNKTVEVTIAGQTVTPDEGYSLGSVTIRPILDTPFVYPSTERHVQYFQKPAQGVIVLPSQTKPEVSATVKSSLVSQTVTPEAGKVFNSVTVQPITKIENITISGDDEDIIFSEPVKGVHIEAMDIQEQLLNLAYPVGSIYMSTINNSPADFLGGMWNRLEDKFLIGTSDNFPTTNPGGAVSQVVNITGSANGHVLTVAELPEHKHTGIKTVAGGTYYDNKEWFVKISGEGAATEAGTLTITASEGRPLETGETGSGSAHTHTLAIDPVTVRTMPPYQPVYMWQRIA